MKKIINSKIILFILLVFIVPMRVSAKRGCCSHHGGVAGCNENGRQICRDGTLSPTCTCTPTVTYIYGCTDSSAKNYNSKANKNDGSCKYYVYGCTDPEAKNYDINAEKDDNSCEYYKYGCTDPEAINYDLIAEKDDGTCEYENNKIESTDDSNGFIPVLTLGGIGAGVYYYKKNKQKKHF